MMLGGVRLGGRKEEEGRDKDKKDRKDKKASKKDKKASKKDKKEAKKEKKREKKERKKEKKKAKKHDKHDKKRRKYSSGSEDSDSGGSSDSASGGGSSSDEDSRRGRRRDAKKKGRKRGRSDSEGSAKSMQSVESVGGMVSDMSDNETNKGPAKKLPQGRDVDNRVPNNANHNGNTKDADDDPYTDNPSGGFLGAIFNSAVHLPKDARRELEKKNKAEEKKITGIEMPTQGGLVDMSHKNKQRRKSGDGDEDHDDGGPEAPKWGKQYGTQSIDDKIVDVSGGGEVRAEDYMVGDGGRGFQNRLMRRQEEFRRDPNLRSEPMEMNQNKGRGGGKGKGKGKDGKDNFKGGKDRDRNYSDRGGKREGPSMGPGMKGGGGKDGRSSSYGKGGRVSRKDQEEYERQEKLERATDIERCPDLNEAMATVIRLAKTPEEFRFNIQKLLQDHGKINMKQWRGRKGNTLLHELIIHQDLTTLDKLVNGKTRVYRPEELDTQRDSDKNTPLHLALYFGQMEGQKLTGQKLTGSASALTEQGAVVVISPAWQRVADTLEKFGAMGKKRSIRNVYNEVPGEFKPSAKDAEREEELEQTNAILKRFSQGRNLLLSGSFGSGSGAENSSGGGSLLDPSKNLLGPRGGGSLLDPSKNLLGPRGGGSLLDPSKNLLGGRPNLLDTSSAKEPKFVAMEVEPADTVRNDRRSRSRQQSTNDADGNRNDQKRRSRDGRRDSRRRGRDSRRRGRDSRRRGRSGDRDGDGFRKGGDSNAGASASDPFAKFKKKSSSSAANGPQSVHPSATPSSAAAPELNAGSKLNLPPPEELQKLDANQLTALAMEAMLDDDMDTHDALTEMAKNPELKMEYAGGGPPTSHASSTKPTIITLEQVDGQGRSRKLMKEHSLEHQTASVATKSKLRGVGMDINKDGEVERYYKDDDDCATIEDLVRKERIQGVQNYDKNWAEHVIKKGAKFHHVNVDDEDEALHVGAWEEKGKKIDPKKARELAEKQRKKEAKHGGQNLYKCAHCLESQKFAYRNSMLFQTETCYVALENWKFALLPMQMVICPIQHGSGTTASTQYGCACVNDFEEDVFRDFRNVQKSIINFFRAMDKVPIFVEVYREKLGQAQELMGGGPHCVVHVYPVGVEYFGEARSMFELELRNAESEFDTSHKAVIKCGGGEGKDGKEKEKAKNDNNTGNSSSAKKPTGFINLFGDPNADPTASSSTGSLLAQKSKEYSSSVKGNIARGFPYYHVDFGLQDGFAHPIHDKLSFPRNFTKDVLCGLLEIDAMSQKGYHDKDEFESVHAMVKGQMEGDEGEE